MSVYGLTDLHGCYDVWQSVLANLNDDDKVFFLGDAIDRGPDGWQIFKEILYDKRFTYIRGNHEDMMVECFNDPTNDRADWIWACNGGYSTRDAMDRDPEAKEHITKFLNESHIKMIYKTPFGENILLCHSGNDGTTFYNSNKDSDFLWDRLHYMSDEWHGNPLDVVVHGHTPISYLIEDRECAYRKIREFEIDPFSINAPYRYANGHKVDLDCMTVKTGKAFLFNLDTYQTIVCEGVK